MESIGVRDLRQHAGRYLARDQQGETLEVTDPGRLVARLVPVVSEAWTDLVSSDRVIVADSDSDLADELPGDYGVDASSTLAAMRDNER